ncbi:MAG: capsid assembly scaffolding protein Gp46 family protein [Fusobacteriaceae bacterium]
MVDVIIDDVVETKETTVKTFTEEEVNRIISDRLIREKKAFEKKQTETVTEYEKRIKTINMTAEQKYKFELDEREKALAEKEMEIKNLTSVGLKKSILSKHKLNEGHLKYIAGDSEEEIENNVVEYLDTIGNHWKSQAGSTPSQMKGGSEAKEKDFSDSFDRAWAKY